MTGKIKLKNEKLTLIINMYFYVIIFVHNTTTVCVN